MTAVTTTEVAELLSTLLQSADAVEELTARGGDDLYVRTVSTFADAGVMTMNDGLVVELSDGREFQLTVVRA